VVTRQLQVAHRTGKVCRPKTNVLPLCHTANQTVVVVVAVAAVVSLCTNLNEEPSDWPNSGRLTTAQSTPVGQCGPIPVRANSLPSAIRLQRLSEVAENVENVREPVVAMSSMVAGADTSCSREHESAPVDDDKQKIELLLCCSQIPVLTQQVSRHYPLPSRYFFPGFAEWLIKVFHVPPETE